MNQNIIKIDRLVDNDNNDNDNKNKNKNKNKQRRSGVISDQPKGEDGLNYTDYANAFGYMMSNPHIALPVTIGIYSSWGTGKSFLLGKIKEYIEININLKNSKERERKRRKCICNTNTDQNQESDYILIDFNAWSYSFSDVLWAGLIREIHTKVEDKYGFLALRFFRFFIYPFRSNSKQKMACIVLYSILRFICLVIFTILLSAMLTEDAFVDIFGEIAIYSAFGLTIATILPSIIQLIITLCKDKGTEIMKGAKNIADQVGFMGDVRDELELICDFVKMKNAKFAVFIDDLDRCPPEKIVNMIDASMLLLSNLDHPFLTFMAIDPRIIVKSIESTYHDVFHTCGITGFEYLDKIIQIPFSIPMASPQIKRQIIQILVREKEDVLNIVFDLCVYFAENDLYFQEIKIDRYSNKNDELTYNDKIAYVKSIYTYITNVYGEYYNSDYVFDITNTADILKFLLNLLRYLKDKHENIKYGHFKVMNGVSRESIVFKPDIEMAMYLSSESNLNKESENGELKNVIINKSEDDASKNIFTPEIQKAFNRIKGRSEAPPCDVDFNVVGKFLQDKKTEEFDVLMKNDLNELNDVISEFYLYLKDFMESKSVRFSPIINELDKLHEDFEKKIRTLKKTRGSLYFHSLSMLSIKEMEYFHEIEDYFDGNCRRNKRIINVYCLIKNILGDRINGWYKSCPVTIYNLKILIKLVVLFEQWPYKMCAIFQVLENYKIRLGLLPNAEPDDDIEEQEKEQENVQEKVQRNDSDNETLPIHQWFYLHRFCTLQDVYEIIPEYILDAKNMHNMQCHDYNKFIFERFLNVEPIIKIDYFYICIGYIFNINYSIKNMISKMLNDMKFGDNLK